MQMIFAAGPSVLTRALQVGSVALSRALDGLHEARIAWPSDKELELFSDAVEAYQPALPGGCFGFIDGTVMRIDNPVDPLIQNAYFNGSKGYAFINNCVVFAPDGCVVWTRMNCPGSWHDSRVSGPFYKRLAQMPPSRFGDHYVLADKAFKATGILEGKVLKSSTKEGKPLAHPLDIFITSTRQAVEWGMRVLKGPWPRLTTRLTTRPHERLLLVANIVRLSNFRTRMMEINQIRTVMRIPQDDDSDSDEDSDDPEDLLHDMYFDDE